MMATFSLVKEPWIPCVMASGKEEPFGLRDVLVKAHEIREVLDSSPLVTAALHRLLLAILHRNFGPKNLEAWKDLRQAGKWDAQTLDAYFRRWEHRFRLFDEDRPFYQVATLEDSEEHPAAHLAHELASGHNPTLFDHDTDEAPEAIEPAVAARYLLAFQSFAIGFGKSKPFYFSDAPLVRGFTVSVIGANLFETLALNMVAYNRQQPIPWGTKEEDLPAWEQENPQEANRNGNVPRGYVDYLTWQSRRIQLLVTPDGKSVRGCRIRQNLKVADPWPLDPMKCYERKEDMGLVPRGLSEDRALWRDSHVLFQVADDSFKRPDVFNWIARAKRDGVFGAGLRRTVSALGFATAPRKAASVTFWRHERLPLHFSYLDDPSLISMLAKALDVAEETRRYLVRATSILALVAHDRLAQQDLQDRDKVSAAIKELNKKNTKWRDTKNLAHVLRPERLYWSRLEVPFRELLEDLPAGGRDEKAQFEHRQKVLDKWRDTLWRRAWESLTEVTRSLDSSARVLKAVVAAEREFRRHLARIVPRKEAIARE